MTTSATKTTLTLAGTVFLALSATADLPQFDAMARQADALVKQAIEADPDLQYAPNRVLVKFRADSTEQDRALAREAVGMIASSKYDLVPGLERLDTAVSLTEAMALLGGMQSVEYVEPDFVVRADASPNDEGYDLLWGMENAKVPQAWNTRTDGSGVVVAVIDTGVAWDHPDLWNNIWINPGEGLPMDGIDNDGNGIVDDIIGLDFYDYDVFPYDEAGHGTHVAGTIGAEGNNGIGVAGVSWNAQIMVMRFLGPDGRGDTSDAMYCLEYAVSMGAKISNNSWGGGPYSQAMRDMLEAAASYGHLAICAAGNEANNNDQNASYPGSYDTENILSIAAIDINDNMANFSNYGQSSVDIAAPGVDILSTVPGDYYDYPDGTYDFLDGTSMASPHVAGLAALIWSEHPTWTYQQVKAAILNTARPVQSLQGLCLTGGTIDANAALQYNGSGGGGNNTRPAQPANLRANGRSGSALLTWNDMSSNEQLFQVQRQKKKRGGSWRRKGKANLSANTESLDWSSGRGLYRYRIRTRNTNGRSRWTGWVEARVTR